MIRASSPAAQEFILQLVTPIGQPVGIAPDERAVARQVPPQASRAASDSVPVGRGDRSRSIRSASHSEDFLAVLHAPRRESILVLRDRLHDPGGGQLAVGGEPLRRVSLGFQPLISNRRRGHGGFG